MLYACSNTLIVDSSDIAKHVNYERNAGVKCVTIDGTVFHKAGLITGGQASSSNSKRWEDKEMEGLKKIRENLVIKLKDIQALKRGDSGRSLDSLKDLVIRESAELTNARSDLEVIDARISSIRVEAAHLKKELESKEPALLEIDALIQVHQDEIDEIQLEIDAVQDRIFSPFCKKYSFSNVREYEAMQVQFDVDVKEKRSKFNNQIAKLNNMFVFLTLD